MIVSSLRLSSSFHAPPIIVAPSRPLPRGRPERKSVAGEPKESGAIRTRSDVASAAVGSSSSPASERGGTSNMLLLLLLLRLRLVRLLLALALLMAASILARLRLVVVLLVLTPIPPGQCEPPG